MKKRILFTCMLVGCFLYANAQLKLDESGNVIIGTSTANSTASSTLDIRSIGDSCSILLTRGNDLTPLHLSNKLSVGYLGSYASNRFRGLRISGTGTTISGNQSYQLTGLYSPHGMGWNYAALNVANNTNPAINAATKNSTRGAIAASSYTQSSTSYCYTGYYVDAANQTTNMVFYVKADGTVLGKNGFIQSSDISKKENIDSISSESALSALTSLRGVSFDYKDKKQYLPRQSTTLRAATLKTETDEFNTSGLREEITDDPESIPEEIQAQINAENNRKRIGLIAQEVEAVIPEVVRTLPDGSKGIMYSDLVGLIIEGMKEIRQTVQAQAARLDSMQQALDFYKSLVPSVWTSENTADITGLQTQRQSHSDTAAPIAHEVVLYQNTPNPFTHSTEVVYSVPEGIREYSLCIYDFNGQLVIQYPLTGRTGKITVNGADLNPGNYIYALTSEGGVLASRRMIRK